MKLRLGIEHDIAVLSILEDVAPENIPVLKAGITKLFKSGKNRIILNLVDAKFLAMEVVREVLKLHLVAAELHGEVVLVGQGNMIKQAIRSFSSPPPVKYFSTKEAAISQFQAGKKGAGAGAKAKDDKIATLEELQERLKELEKENQALRGRLAGRKLDELRKLRFENGVFQHQLNMMEEQLKELVKERKKPFVMESISAKLLQLEAALNEFLINDGLIQTKE